MPLRISAELAQLARLARDGGLDLSQVSLRVKADLLMTMPEPPQDDIATFGEMAEALIPTIDENTAVILARKLAGWRHTPPAVLTMLRAHGDLVLATLLRHGMPIPQAEIETLAEQGASEVAAALAERADLSPTASHILAGRNERDTDLALIANGAAPIPRAALDRLLQRARGDAAYAPGLLARTDITSTELTPLFLQAGPERRTAILESLSALDSLAPSEQRRPRLAGETLSAWIAMAGDDKIGALGVIASHIGADETLTAALAEDSSRDLTALALIAAGATVEDATRFLIRLGDETAHSVDRIFALVALMRYARPAVAQRVVMQVAGVRAQPMPRKGRHQPAMDPSGTPSRVGAAKPDNHTLVTGMIRRLGLQRELG